MNKSKWETCELGDCLIPLRTGLNPRKNYVLNEEGACNYYITVRELNGRGITVTNKTDKFCDYAFPLINHRSNLRNGDVLFSGTGSIGRTALVTEKPKTWNIKEGVYVLKPQHDKLDSIYLLHFLHSELLLEYCRTFSKGATIQSVPMARLRSANIKLPHISIQKAIATELDAIQAMIDGYKAQISDLDALAQSIFLDMFGDVVNNDRRWSVISFVDITSSINYGTSLPAVEDGKYKYLRMWNISPIIRSSNLRFPYPTIGCGEDWRKYVFFFPEVNPQNIQKILTTIPYLHRSAI